MRNQYSPDGGQRSTATDDDTPEIQDAVVYRDGVYSLNVIEIQQRFFAAGIERTERTIQRYCKLGHIDAMQFVMDNRTIWFADPQSVDTRINEILQLEAALPSRRSTTGVGTSVSNVGGGPGDIAEATNDETQRPDSVVGERRDNETSTHEQLGDERHTAKLDDDKYLSVPVAVLNALTEQLVEKDKQIERKDEQIAKIAEERAGDRKMLATALHLIHGEDFQPRLSSQPVQDQKMVSAKRIEPIVTEPNTFPKGDYQQPITASDSV